MKNLYSKPIYIFLFFFCFLRAEAQYVTIPDTNFVNWLNANGYAACMSGNMMDTTCGAVVNAISINCATSNINDLEGIQYFDNLIELFCNNNYLTSLPPLPNLLTYLNCVQNQLTSLPSLPGSLIWLELNNNYLTTLPLLPNLLIFLNCDQNQLTSLPSLPNSLTGLLCFDNQLTSLPSLPNSLNYLNCSYNQLTSLPSLPDSIFVLILYNNPALTCFPKYKIIQNLYWSNTGISCLPYTGYIGKATPSISNLPLCKPASGCAFGWNIFGSIYRDGNGNCTLDSSELLLKNIPVKLDSKGVTVQSFISNTTGYYSFAAGLGNYQISIDTAGLPLEVICPIAGKYISTITAADSLDADMDFALQCKPGFDVGVTSVARDSGLFFPANFAKVKINAGDISNFLHCAAGTGGAVEVILSGPVSYTGAASGSLVPVVSGNTLVYSIADFGTVNSETDFMITVQIDTSAVAGQQICFSVNVTPATGDLNASNNSLQHCFTVVNSYDPNNKEAYPQGSIDTSQHWLTYTVNFQNTGTAPAQNIYILDTLDADLNTAAFAFLSSSHGVISQMLPGNILRFSFPNINLPDSVSDEPNSHGYVQYKVKLTDGLPLGTVISNTANIFFDFNAPVVTNTTVNEIRNLTSLTPGPSPEEMGVVLFPNPVIQNELAVKFYSSFSAPVTFELSDMTGRKVFSRKMLSSAAQQIIRLPDLSNGMYNCTISFGDKRINKKIALLRK